MWSSPAQTEPCSLSTRRGHANPLPALSGPWIILSTRTSDCETALQITECHSSDDTPAHLKHTEDRFAWEEHVYDFAMPVLRTEKGDTSLTPFSIQMDEGSISLSPIQPELVSGVVQIGLTDAHLQYELASDDQKYFRLHRLHHRRKRVRRLPAFPPYHETAEEPGRCRSTSD